MKLAILDDDNGEIVSIKGGYGMRALERELVGPLALRIAEKVGILRKEKIRKQVEDEIIAFFSELKEQTVHVQNPR